MIGLCRGRVFWTVGKLDRMTIPNKDASEDGHRSADGHVSLLTNNTSSFPGSSSRMGLEFRLRQASLLPNQPTTPHLHWQAAQGWIFYYFFN